MSVLKGVGDWKFLRDLKGPNNKLSLLIGASAFLVMMSLGSPALAMFGYGPAMGMGGFGMGGFGMSGYGMPGYGVGGMGNYGIAGMAGYGHGYGVPGAYPSNYAPVVSVPQTVTNLTNGPLTTGTATPLGQNNYSPNGYDNYSKTIQNGGGHTSVPGQKNWVSPRAINNDDRSPSREETVFGGTAAGSTSLK